MQPLKVADFAWAPLLDRQQALWRQGETPTVERLLADSPWADDSDARLDLIYNEIVVREELGQVISEQEYLDRYPQFAAELEIQLELHRAVGNSALFGDALLETDDDDDDVSRPESAARSADEPQTPAQFELLRELGQGGNAVVYLARHRQMRREVALKMFRHGRLPTPRERRRFHAEATAFARLTHPNIIQIYEIGESAGLPFLALEFAAGGTLAQKLQEFPLAPRAAAELIENLARAVQHAHDRQVIHRDLKPANVLFAKDGTPKIADFGLAKVWDTDDVQQDLTRTGEPIGTPRYMAPEQTGGAATRITAAADTYALGTLLYECVTGRAPFTAVNVVDTIQQIRTADPIPPRKLQPHLPRDLETICLCCLQKEPARRYASAAALADDLRRWLRGEPIHARPVSLAEKAWKWCRRRPTEAVLIAAGFLVAIALAAGAVESSRRERLRLNILRRQIATLMQDGQQALAQDDTAVAQARFLEAWRIVQAEPGLTDHTPGVSGWLDHGRRAADKQLWQSRLPPREFDERRDEALVESALAEDDTPEAAQRARDTVQAALELTPAHDPAWDRERDWLFVLYADLLGADRGPAEALDYLDRSDAGDSRLKHVRREEWLRQLERADEAAAAANKVQEFPPDQVRLTLLEGLHRLRAREPAAALERFERVLTAEPAFFVARLLQGVCFLQLDRPAEARVALTACIAQRPNFPWNHYYRSRANRALGDIPAAEADLKLAAELKPTENLRRLLPANAADVSVPEASSSEVR